VAVAALAARVVEVIADLGPLVVSRYRYGSGCIVHGRAVLTAAHVVAGAASVVVRDPDRREYAATVDPQFMGDPDGAGPDLALLEIGDPAFAGELPPIGLAAVDRDSATGEPVERCHAVGYPWFAETPSPTAMRDTVDAIGVVPVLSKLKMGLLSVQVTVTPRELPPEETALGASQWSGMSGAPVFAAGRLLGVVTEHAPREGPSAITAVPLTALQRVADPGVWWSRLGVAGIGDLQRLPLPPPRQPPAYWGTLREFGWTLHRRMPQLLGRERELGEIAAFATGSEGYRRLGGEAYAGKTSLLYEAVTVGLPDEVDVVCYFLSRRKSDASAGRFLEAVVPQLAYLCEVDTPDVTVDQYHALWEQAAGRAAQRGRHLLLAVDGLDEDRHPPGSSSVASLLPVIAGTHAHVLVTSRLHPDLPEDMPDEHPLTRVMPVRLDPFTGAQRLASLAKTEIYNLTHGDDSDVAVDVLGLLTAAEGPLSLSDLVALRSGRPGAPTAAETRQVRRVVEERAARSLERVGPAGGERYEFAHASLLEYAQTVPDLLDWEHRERIHRWADRWRDAGWPPPDGGDEGTPQYLLDTYPATLARDPRRLAQLVGDIGWVEAAVASAGVDRVLGDLRRAVAADPADAAVTAVLEAVTGQAYDLRPPQPVGQPGYILRQLWMQAAELGDDGLAEDIRRRLQSRPGAGLVPQWTTRRAGRAFAGELGRHRRGLVAAVAVLPDGRVVTGGEDSRVLLWDPAVPGLAAELGRHDGGLTAVAVLPGERVVTGGWDGRVLIWDLAAPGTAPAELGRHDGAVGAVAVLLDGRVVTGGGRFDGRVLMWDPASLGAAPVVLGLIDGEVAAMAVLPDGRVVTGGDGGRVLLWDPGAPGAAPVELGRHDRGAVGAVAVLLDGRVVTGGWVRVLLWDPGAPGAVPVELGRHDAVDRDYSWVGAVAVLPDGRVVTGGHDRRVLLWDPAALGTSPAELGRHDGWLHAVAVLPDGRVVTGGLDGRVLLWDPAGLGTSLAELGGDDSRVAAVAMLPDGRVVTGGYDGRVLLWDPAGPGTSPAVLGRHDGEVGAVAVLPDERVVTGGHDGRVLIWDPDGPAAPAELGRHAAVDAPKSLVTAVAVLPDGRVVTGDFDRRVLLWDPASLGAAPVMLGLIDGEVAAVAVLPDGRVVTGGDNGRLASDPDDGRVLLWDPASPGAAPVLLGRHDNWVTAVAVLPDGRVVTGGHGGGLGTPNDGGVLLWDPASPGAAPVVLGRHDGTVTAMAVLPDGRVITGGGDKRALLWDPAEASTQVIQLSCWLLALATTSRGAPRSTLAIAHIGGGLSLWSVTQLAFSSCVCLVDLQYVDGLGELAGAPGAAAELAEDVPGLELGVRALAG
jgi:WD40 repeat protein